MRLCQAMEQQTRQRCLNLDISRSVSEEIRSPGQASQGQDRGEPGLEALFLRPSPAASDKGAARPGAPGAAWGPGPPGCGAPRGERGRAGAAGRENKGAGEGRPGPGPAGGTAARVFPLN